MKGPRVGFWLHCPLWTSGAFYLLVRVVPSVNGLVEEQGTGVDPRLPGDGGGAAGRGRGRGGGRRPGN